MQQDFISKINSAIRFSFYTLFFLVPLIMWPTTYELYEFNKMWLVFVFSIFIAFLWAAKSVVQKRFDIRRTPLDIPLALFLLSQIISTIISIDPHTSIWGYYSRFNGGLLSTIAYIFLYYAFATNLASADSESKEKISYKLLATSLLSGLAVALWGLPSHFGADPTCLVFRGDFDVSCWTAAFQPTIRIFSTLGQPNWLGTYLAALIPITLGFGLYKLNEKKTWGWPLAYIGLALFFFISILWTRSQSSFVGLIVGMVLFAGVILYKNLSQIKKFAKNDISRYFIVMIVVFAGTNFIMGNPVGVINKFTSFSGLQSLVSNPTANPQPPTPATEGGLNVNQTLDIGGSDSGNIRQIVWEGAIELFKRNPLFGTGVETFAHSYYNVKPLAHNLTSEWDYLYNKAHNEYLNYLSTTGIFGLGSYLLIIGFFGYQVARTIFAKSESEYFPISLGIAAGFAAMLVSNFFGFSVVVINLFIFIFPILFLDLENNKILKKMFSVPRGTEDHPYTKVLPIQTIAVAVLAIIALVYELQLLNFWNADKKYALGYNLDHASEYGQGYQPLLEAVKMLPSEDLYKDELSINMATLSLLLSEQKDATQAAAFGQQAKALSDEVVARHPNNVIYLKTRARVFFALSELDPTYIDRAIETVEKARKLAPTDAKLAYNEGLFYQQKGEPETAIKYVNEAIKMKPNYGDAYYSLSLIYADAAKMNPAKKAEYVQKQKEALEYILKNIDPKNKSASDLLKSLE